MRKALRARRAAVSRAERRCAAIHLVTHALGNRLLARKRRIGFYVPAGNEIDVMPLFARAAIMGSRCYLPIVPERGRRKLWFVQAGGKNAWVLNRYGIPEYQPPGARKIRAYQLDLLFMPLLGFDARGGRIGMGGGYYDASLARLAQGWRWRHPRLVGVAFSVQQVDHVPRDAWDVLLNGVLTERGFLPTGRSQ